LAEELKKFSVDNIQMFQNDDDVDFALAEVWSLADGNNSHKNPISLEVLKRDAHTMLGKFLVAKYSNWSNDATSHAEDEQIVGYFPKDSKISFKEKDGKTFAVFEALVSKLYATPIYQLFKDHNFRSVSTEFSCVEGMEDENGNKPIEKLTFHGCTILGLSYSPSCEGAEMNIKRFSTEDADKYYNSHNLSELQKFAERRREELAKKEEKYVSHPVNRSKDAIYSGGWDGEKTKKDLVKEKDFEKIAPEICLELDAGWQDREVTKLKYPVMTLHNGEWVYSREGLASAKAYANNPDRGNPTVAEKINAIYKELDLDDKDKEDKKNMESKKFSELEGRELYSAVIEKIQKKLGKSYYVEAIYSDHIEVRNESTKEMLDIPADISLGKDDEDMKIDIDYDGMKKSKVQKFEKKKMDDDEDEEEDAKEGSIPDDKKDVKDGEGDDSEAEEFGKKKMSLDANAYAGSILQMLIAETEEERKQAMKLGEDEEMDVVMNKLYGVATEMAELKSFKAEKMEEEKKLAVEKIMAGVKSDIDNKDFEDLYGKGMACKYEELKQFETTVKAFAYENSKTRTKKFNDNEDVFMGFSFNNSSKDTSKEDVFKKYL